MKKLLVYIKEGFHLFEKKLFLHLFLIIEIALAALILQYNIVTTGDLTANYRIIRNIGAERGVHLYANTGMNFGNVVFETPLDLSGLTGEYALAESVIYGLTLDNSASAVTERVQSYNTVFLQELQAPLSQGSWESECQEENGITYYPIVINREQRGLSLGDKSMLRSGSTEIPVYVAGVLAKDGRYIDLSKGSNIPTAEQIVGRCTENGLYVFFNSDLYPESIKSVRLGALSHRFLYFSDAIADEEYTSNLQYLRNIGWVNEINTVLQNTEENLQVTMRYYIPLFVASLLVSLAGLLSFSLLSVYQNVRYYGILLLSGSTRRDCIGISALSFLYMALGAVLAFFLLLFVFSMPFSATSVLVAVGMCLASSLLGVFFPWGYIGRHRVAYLMREIL